MNRAFIALTLMSFGALLSGCVSSPTYGTDKSSSEQLFEDLGNIASLKTQKGAAIDYKPRPDLVTPPSTSSLPEPQVSVVKNEQVWPESPEETRARIVAEITENQDNPGYVSPLGIAGPNGKSLTRGEQREAYRKARAIQQGAYQERRFLSDPPAGYKVPASTAPIGELGETEREKEKRRLEGVTKAGTGKKWWQVWKR
jgi:hypothetical protein